MIDSQLLAKIPYTFIDKTLLEKALTHPSTSRTRKVSDFERLEFLGDRVLGLIVAQMLYERYPKEKEGDLAKRLAVLVCRDACLDVANQMNLSDHLKASLNQNALSSTILADATEAIIGALYLDGGLEAASVFIKMYWPNLLEKNIRPPKDAKTELQELAQSKNITPLYETIERSGPAHTPTFKGRVMVSGIGKALGTGTSKRQAEQKAAKALLEKLK